MTKARLMLLSTTLTLGIIAVSVFATAQAVAAGLPGTRSAYVQSAAASTASNPLQARMSLNLKGVTLRAAIDSIKSKAALQVSYRRESVDNKPRVTINATRITTAEAFRKILAGTGLQLVHLPSGQLAIMEREIS